MQETTNPIPAEASPRVQTERPPRSGVIEVDNNLCLTCRECEVACSLYHELECNPAQARIRIEFDDFQPVRVAPGMDLQPHQIFLNF